MTMPGPGDCNDRAQLLPHDAYPVHSCFQIALDDGARLNALRWSERGTPCILLHGLGDAACVWSDFSRRMGGQLQPIALDLRGHGFSSWDATEQYEAQLLVQDVARAIVSLGIDRLILVGHSLGGDIVIRLAAQTSARILAVVLVDVGPDCSKAGIDRVSSDLREMPWSYDAVAQYAQWLATRRLLARRGLLDELARYALRRRADQRFELRLDPALRALRHCREVDADGMYRDATLWRALRRIECPALVIRGLGSAVLPRSVARSMAVRSLPRGTLVEIEHAGHSVMMDNPDGFHAAVASFLHEFSVAHR